MLATLAYHIHDLMVDRVKKYKHSMDGTTSDIVSDDTPATSILRKQNQFATVWWICTHSMIKKRKKAASSISSADTLTRSECQFLESLKSKEDERELIPSAIHHLQQGGLTIITPECFPSIAEKN